MGHVFARITGHGWTIVPRAPYRIGRLEGTGPRLRVEHLRASVTLSLASGLDVQLGPSTTSLESVCDVSRSEAIADFLIETSVFSVGWPRGFDVVGGVDAGPIPFDLVNGEDGLVYVQGPFDSGRPIPSIDRMVAPGQQVMDIGTDACGEWIELAYEHGGVAHWQRHSVVTFRQSKYVVTAQSPSSHASIVRAAGELVATTFHPTS